MLPPRPSTLVSTTSRAALVIALLLVSVPAAHSHEVPESEAAVDTEHRLSVTFSPVHLLLPALEVTGEYAVSNRFGLALVVGGGSISFADELTARDDEATVTFWNAGVQARWYAIGDFDAGLQLGAEAQYTHLSASFESDETTASGVANGGTLGPFLGGKWTASTGFTLDGQIGVAWYLIHAGAESSDGAEDSDTVVGTEPTVFLNLNLGWSF